MYGIINVLFPVQRQGVILAAGQSTYRTPISPALRRINSPKIMKQQPQGCCLLSADAVKGGCDAVSVGS